MQRLAFALGEGDEVALGRGERVRIYRWGAPRPLWERTLGAEPQALALTPRAVYGVVNGKLLQMFRTLNEPSQPYPLPSDRVGAPLDILAHGMSVFCWTSKGALCHATLPEAQWRILTLGRASITAVVLCDRWLAAADEAGTAHLVERDSWKLERAWQCGLGGVMEWQYHPQRRWLAAACADGLVKVWELPTARLVGAFASHRYGAERLAWHLPTAHLVSWSEDGLLWFYDVAANRALSDRILGTPRELRGALALRWQSETLVEVWTTDAFWHCRLPDGKWHTIKLS